MTEQKTSIAASGYVLLVPESRRSVLLHGSTIHEVVAEPVQRIEHSRRAPLVVFASFRNGKITHIADGRKGINAGTALSRLNLTSLRELSNPIDFAEVERRVSANFRSSIRRRFEGGGLLTPKGFVAVVEALLKIDATLGGRLSRYSLSRQQAIRAFSPPARQNLAIQKETVTSALKIAGIETRELLEWVPRPDQRPNSYLDGLDGVSVREDVMLDADHDIFPGLVLTGRIPHLSTKVFQGDGKKLFVTMANRLPLEQQTGADLIYYNATFGSFVMVQYKAMEKRGNDGAVFRLPNAQLDIEIERMEKLLGDLRKIAPDEKRDGFRLNENPFYLKLCSRIVFNADDSGLFPGMYIPLDYWKRAVLDPGIAGPKGGKRITFENIGRKLSSAEFIILVANAWVGTTLAQSALLQKLVERVIAEGRTITIAIKEDDEDDGEPTPAGELFYMTDEDSDKDDLVPPVTA